MLANHFWFGRRFEVAPQDVRRDAVRVLRVRRRHPEAPPLVALQPVLAHHTRDALVIDRAALRLADLGGHSASAVAASMFALGVADLADQVLVVLDALRGCSHACGVETAARDRQQLAHQRRRIDLSMLLDPCVLHIDPSQSTLRPFF